MTEATREAVVQALYRALPDGRLQRIPRHPRHRDILLAIVALPMLRRYPYPEREINEFLQARLAQLRAKVDHVTLRRSLVDLGFVRRNRTGTRYFADFPRIEATLAPEVMASADALIADALALRRKRNSASGGQHSAL